MTKMFYVGIEPLENRYTTHWDQFHPEMFKKNTDLTDVYQVVGKQSSSAAEGGAFLNFVDTTIWKSTQLIEISNLFANGRVESGDIFFFADAWNPLAHQVRYMSDLCKTPVVIIGVWHAGSYDKYDLLGRHFEDKVWSYQLERSLHTLYDLNHFATNFHRKLFQKEVLMNGEALIEYEHVGGFPMEYYKDMPGWFEDHSHKKENIIVFPHRVSPEKNPDLFMAIKARLPEYEFIIAQDHCKNKKEYQDLLARAKIVWSANLQETLGIGTFEGMMMGCHPIVPDRLSYREMYPSHYRYQEAEGVSYLVENQVELIRNVISSYNAEQVLNDAKVIFDKFFTGTTLYTKINGFINKG